VRAPSAAELLQVWEQGAELDAIQRALLLLAACQPKATLEELVSLPIGARDARLLTLRRTLFGDWLTGLVDCPQCGQRLELELDTSEMAWPSSLPKEGSFQLENDGFVMRYRLPNSEDLAAIMDSPEDPPSGQDLIERCLVEVLREGQSVPASDLSPKAIEALDAALAGADPGALVKLEHNCPECGHNWSSIFDILTFLWSEIHVWAQQILLEVHLLASAYGWSENDILNLSPWRRRYYLELIAG
jgi:hypothetical protein